MDISTDSGIHLLLGPPNSGKLGWVVRWWRSLEARRPLIVTPSLPDVETVLGELLERVGCVVGEPPVGTFDELAGSLYPGGGRVVGRLEEELLAWRLLDTVRLEALGYLAGVTGGARALGALLRELDESGLSEQEIASGLEWWARNTRSGSVLPGEVALVFGAYRKLCTEAGVFTREQRVARAAVACAAWSRPVACYGFTTFTPGQRTLLRALARHVPVVVALPWERGRFAARHVQAELAEWESCAASREIFPAQTLAYSSGEIAFVERRFMHDPSGDGTACDDSQLTLATERPAPPVSAQGDVRLVVSAGRRNEIELVANEIVALLRGGYEPYDIAVLVRSTEPWVGLVEEAFAEVGVPFVLDAHIPFRRTGLGHALLRLYEAVRDDSPERLLGFLRSPYHRLSPEQVDRFELELSARRRSGGAFGREEKGALCLSLRLLPPEAAALVDLIESLEATVLAEAKSSVAREQGLDASRCAGPLSLSGAASVVLAEMADYMLLSAAGQGFVADARLRGQLERDARARAVACSSLRALPVLGQYEGAVPLSVLVSHLAELPVWMSGGGHTGVQVMTVGRSRARRSRVVFVLGLVQGEFPASQQSPSLVPFGERAVCNRADGPPILRTRSEGEDAFLFWLAVSRPWEVLYLSTRDTDEDGQPEMPSPFIEEVAALLEKKTFFRARGLSEVSFRPGQAATPRQYLRGCVDAGLAVPDGLGSQYEKRPSAWFRPPGVFHEKAVLAELGTRRTFSATELETYVTCPFLWFVERVVRPAELEQDWGPREAGQVVHRVLQVVFEALSARRRLPLRPSCLPEALASADEALEAVWPAMDAQSAGGDSGEETGGLLLLRSQVRLRVHDELKTEAEAGSSLVTCRTEYVLSPAVEILPRLCVTGTIDRIDCHPKDHSALVIDYKFGKVGGGSFADEGLLQVPLYMLCLARGGWETPLLGGAYISLGSAARSGRADAESAQALGDWLPAKSYVSRDVLEEELERCAVLADEAAERIRGGDIHAQPRGECPAFCRLTPVCHVRKKTWARR